MGYEIVRDVERVPICVTSLKVKDGEGRISKGDALMVFYEGGLYGFMRFKKGNNKGTYLMDEDNLIKMAECRRNIFYVANGEASKLLERMVKKPEMVHSKSLERDYGRLVRVVRGLKRDVVGRELDLSDRYKNN
jgi:hypothetical protein